MSKKPKVSPQAKGRAKKNGNDSLAARTYKLKDGTQGGGRLRGIDDDPETRIGPILDKNKKLTPAQKLKGAQMLGRNKAQRYIKTTDMQKTLKATPYGTRREKDKSR